jgi:hypothetical protein
VPRDALLRGASPQEVIGAIRVALDSVTPTPKGVQFLLVRNEADYLKVEQRWTQIRRKMGIASPAKIDREASAIRFLGDVMLSPEVVGYLGSSDIYDRVRGASVVLHEWWHSARTQAEAFLPFEEGTADVFAEIMAKKLFGVEIPDTWQPYKKLSEAVNIIGETLGNPEWFLESRKQTDVKEWLRGVLSKHGFSVQTINRVLSYTGFEDLWLEDVKRMVETG